MGSPPWRRPPCSGTATMAMRARRLLRGPARMRKNKPVTTPEAAAACGPEPARDCPICPRLVAYRETNRAAHPDWFNGPAPSFGDPQARLLVLGLAPGR